MWDAGHPSLLMIWIAREAPANTPQMIFLAALLFALCPDEGKRITCVVDGDTFWHAGEKIRIEDIDAPETHPPRCTAEAALGNRATV